MKDYIFIINAIILFSPLFLTFTSCTFIEEKSDVHFVLTGLEEVKSSDSWLVEYYDEKGILCHFELRGYPEFYLSMEKGHVTPVTVKGLSGKKKNLVWGNIYPLSSALNLHAAFAAQVFSGIMEASLSPAKKSLTYLKYFNWGKLIEETSSYPEVLYDKGRIMTSIANGTFKKGDIKALEK
ncbi:hypothetical protein [Treponema sp.]|uniref:hypothetical protein n=1 Tax=Treponema sp. TaxID=166 RepID=UPI0025F2ECB6|nr:hypothetical protein [Treponema sp.]MCR5219084.1 hypothetical protein [Treponema sp.]